MCRTRRDQSQSAVPLNARARSLITKVALRLMQGYVRVEERVRASRNVVVYYAWPDFERKARALVYELEQAGIRVVLKHSVSFVTRARIRYSQRLHIGFWNHYYPEYLPARYIFYNAEPLRFSRWRDNAEWRRLMERATAVWGYSPFDEAYVQSLKLPFRYVPFGYSSFYEHTFRRNTEGMPSSPDIDVLFFGHVTPRRQAILDQIRATGLRLETVTYDQPLRGAALDRMIARAKIVLSVFASDDPGAQSADFARLDHLLANGRFVLHEQLPESSPDAEFEEHVPTSHRDLVAELCVYFAGNKDAREQAALKAHLWFKSAKRLAAFIPVDEVRSLSGS